MQAAVCLLHEGQLNRAGDVAKLGEFLGEFSWEELFTMDVRGLKLKFLYIYNVHKNQC